MKKLIYLLYFDANNLYGYAMSQPLPTDDLTWEKYPNYYNNIPEGRGCIVEVDLEYTPKCKTKTRKFLLAPEKLKINEEDLSNIQLQYLQIEDKNVGQTEKLILNLKYVIHYKLLKYYESLGLKITKVHKTISFKEEAWLKKIY